MDSFTYNPNSNQESEHDFSGTLEIHVHHARNIHNICIYDNQDVYAKFSLTYNPDETLTTRIVTGGGKNPDFDEDLIMKIQQTDAVLKCEIWMMSRAKNFMGDQLLGFTLVPILYVFGEGKMTRDFDLSSTDLFHSPAGTIKLSLSLNGEYPRDVFFADSLADSSRATSELLMDEKGPEDYCRVEFPDMNVASENQHMVSEYFARNGRPVFRPWAEKPDGSFLHLGARPDEDCEMAAGNCSYEYRARSVSPDENSALLSSITMTSMSDDRNSVDSPEKKGRLIAEFSTSPDESEVSPRIIVGTSTSKKKNGPPEENGPGLLENEEVEGEEFVIQKQIVDMYMRSMQQFTESLANMELPMGLDKPGIDLIQNGDEKIEIEKKKKDSGRVFYGSSAFF